MANNEYFIDERFDSYCTYCANRPDTRDHVPPKAFLKDFKTSNYQVVPSCRQCNNSHSLDEEFFFALFDCYLKKSTNLDALNPRVSRALLRNNFLHQQVKDSILPGKGFQFDTNQSRVKNVIIKLAKGHLRFQTGLPVINRPYHYHVEFIENLYQEEIDSFCELGVNKLLPEVGSRGFLNLVLSGNMYQSNWTVIEPDYYYYAIIYSDDYIVKILLHDKLAIEIRWRKGDLC